MPTLVIPKTYRDGRAPRVIDLDNIRLTVESFFNVTKLDDSNISLSALSSAISATQAKTIVSSSEIGQTTTSEDSSGAVNVTIEDSGVYIVYLRMTRSLQSSASSSGDSSVSRTANIAINGVQAYNLNLTYTYNSNAISAMNLVDYSIGTVCCVRSFSQGDYISLEDESESASLAVIKLLET